MRSIPQGLYPANALARLMGEESNEAKSAVSGSDTARLCRIESYLYHFPAVRHSELSVARQGDRGRVILESPPDARASGIRSSAGRNENDENDARML